MAATLNAKNKENLITLREVAHILGLPEQDILVLVDKGILPHLRLDDGFLRFKKEDILKAKKVISANFSDQDKKQRFKERIEDFFYFNNFYIVSAIIIFILLLITFNDFHF